MYNRESVSILSQVLRFYFNHNLLVKILRLPQHLLQQLRIYTINILQILLFFASVYFTYPILSLIKD